MRAKQWRQGVLVCILIFAAFWLVSLIIGLSGKARVAVTEAHEVERQYQALEERKAMLESNLAALETARGKDEAIRTAFGVARPGEAVIVVVPPSVATTTPSRSWWHKVLNWFPAKSP